MKPIIDMHSHLLPGVDDGCPSTEEAVTMLRMYEEQNVEAVVCTPHFGPYMKHDANITRTFKQLLRVESSVKLYLGNEIFDDGNVLSCVSRKIAFTLAGSDRILVEFFDYDTLPYIISTINQIKKSRWVPVIAHPERIISLQSRPRFYDSLCRIGAEMQINAYDISDNTNIGTLLATRYLLNKQLVTYIGSDAHGATRRPPMLQNGVKWIYRNLPEEYADAVVHDNAAKIIGGA